jgi:YhcH/YjgK/YiaL family protein
MINDTLDNAATYFNLSPAIATALKFLQRPDLASLSLGKHVVNDQIFALVQEYQTRKPEETFWETHRKYIDVQFIQSGIEALGWSPVQKMKLKREYDPEKELIAWEGKEQLMIPLPAGSFVIFFPHDAHMGGLIVDQPKPVRKIVLKVAVQ